MIRYSLCAACLVAGVAFLSASSVSLANACLDDRKVSEYIEKNSVGVLSALFANYEGGRNIFVFSLKNDNVLSLIFDDKCIFEADVMTIGEYVNSTNDYDECDGC